MLPGGGVEQHALHGVGGSLVQAVRPESHQRRRVALRVRRFGSNHGLEVRQVIEAGVRPEPRPAPKRRRILRRGVEQCEACSVAVEGALKRMVRDRRTGAEP